MPASETPTTHPNESDELISRATVDLRDRLRSLGQMIVAIAFDATGERLAIASSPEKARRYNRKKGYLEGLPQAAWVWVVRVRGGAILHEFELPTQNAEWDDPHGGGLEMDAEPVDLITLTFSPDGAWLAVTWLAHLDPQIDSDCEAIAMLDLERGVVVGSGHGAINPDFLDRVDSDDAALVAAFAPDSRTLVSVCVLWGQSPLTTVRHASRWRLVETKEGTRDLSLSTGARLAFSANGQRLALADTTSGVTFFEVPSRQSLGRSRGVRLEHTSGPLVAAPDGRCAWSVSRVARGGKSQEGLWRWAPRVTPTLVATSPGGADEGWEVLWLARDAREVLWSDPDGALVRQHVADPSAASDLTSPRLTRPRPCSLVKALAGKNWEITVASADGTRLARARDGLVLVTRLRRRAVRTP
jgi:hypothetical protein